MGQTKLGGHFPQTFPSATKFLFLCSRGCVSYFCGMRTMCEQPFLLVYLQTEVDGLSRIWCYNYYHYKVSALAVQKLQLQSITEAISTCSIKQCSLLTWDGSLLYSWTSWHQIWDFPMLSSIVFYKVA